MQAQIASVSLHKKRGREDEEALMKGISNSEHAIIMHKQTGFFRKSSTPLSAAEKKQI